MRNVRSNLALSCILAVLFLLASLTVGAMGMEAGSIASMLASPSNISRTDVLVDVSPNATSYIQGAIGIPYTKFVNDGGVMKPVSEIAQILGDAGISRDDSVVIYGECMPCGGGPSTSTYVYWILKYLGHEKVKVLDGGIKDWVALGKPTSNKSEVRSRTIYIPQLKANLFATFDYVKNGGAQIVDARAASDYSAGSIPRAINIPFDEILKDDKIKNESALKKIFSNLSTDKPVVVFTNTGREGIACLVRADSYGLWRSALLLAELAGEPAHS